MGTLHIYRRQTMHTLTLTLSLSLPLLPQYEARDAVKECLVCSSTYADIDPNPLFSKECADGSKKGQTCQNKNAVGCWVQQTTMKVKDKKDTVKIERGCCVDDISKAGQNADLCGTTDSEGVDGSSIYAKSCYSKNCNTMDAGSMAVLPSLALLVTGILMASYNIV